MKKTEELIQADEAPNTAAGEALDGSGQHSLETQPADAEHVQDQVTYALGLFDGSRVPAVIGDKDQLRRMAVSPGLQALWGALLPMIGVRPARPDEYAGVFKIEPGPADDEATIYIDIPTKPYQHGTTAPMERVVALNVKLSHDYRLLGARYYCVDCEAPTSETRH